MNVFTDASALISLFSEKDSNHQKALGMISKLDKKSAFIISNYVFAEVVTILSQKEGRHKAIIIGDYIKRTYHWINVDQEIEDLAWEIFKKQISKNVSFVDCTTFALFKKGVFDKAFSFDRDFKVNKISLVS